ncbi:MAG: hypothetical protein RR415_12670 [Ruthenibacterium sp.]
MTKVAPVSWKTQGIVYANEFISLEITKEEDEARLNILDSDGEYIDYFCSSDGVSDKELATVIAMIQRQTEGKDDVDVANFLRSHLWSIMDTRGEPIEAVCLRFGREFVNRIGSMSLIVKE